MRDPLKHTEECDIVWLNSNIEFDWVLSPFQLKEST